MYHSSVDDDYCVAVYLFYVAMQVPIVRDQVESKSTHKSWKKWRQDPSWLQTFFYFAHGQFWKGDYYSRIISHKKAVFANAFKSWSEFVMTVDAAKFKGKSRVENWQDFFHFCPLYKNSINRQTSSRGGLQHRAHLWVWLVKRGK